jgi:phenylalanyl-tRNA synthetase beta chain
MPVVDVDPDELRGLTGRTETSTEAFKETLFGLDRLSVEGVARSLRYHYGDDRGVYVPETNDPEWTIEVDSSVPAERPYVTGAVVRGVDLDESGLRSLIGLQEKLHATMGRGRAKGAIGIHDLAMVKGAPHREGAERSVTYRGVEPDGDTFVPLDAAEELTPAGVLESHQTGRTYADLVREYDRYPAIYDDLGLFSFPPVINGRRTEVTTGSRELLVELTGTDQWTIDKMCTIVCYALSARGATIEEVEVTYADDATHPSEYGEALVRPDLEVAEKSVTHDRIETLLGVDFEPEAVVDCFERSGLDATYQLGESVTYDVEIPPYRVDVLHPLDLVDDVGRAYGFDELTPRYPDAGTVGGRHERTRLEDAVRTSLVGLGFEDLLNFHMTSAEQNYDRLRVEPGTGGVAVEDGVFGGGDPVRITEPYSEAYTQLRTWALPSLLQLLEGNTHNAYPQDVSEIGFVAEHDPTANTRVAESRHVAGALARRDASYEAAKGRLQAVCDDFGRSLETPPTDHPTFIEGRVADVLIDGDPVGVIGEVHPAVLVDHDLEVPVAAFEFALDGLR